MKKEVVKLTTLLSPNITIITLIKRPIPEIQTSSIVVDISWRASPPRRFMLRRCRSDYAVLRWEVLHRDQSLQERTHTHTHALVKCSFVSGGSHNTTGSTLALLTAAPRLPQAAKQKGLRAGLMLANEMKHIKYAVKKQRHSPALA